ncbi:hypothetical protein TWF694_005454 [Orbilia ellipsospora]|uniref:Uncharacterized protein n=1 Tax=Orbilia ellipsospora TaxID=2528407 RepID=A0AAV9WU76_9PEZI
MTKGSSSKNPGLLNLSGKPIKTDRETAYTVKSSTKFGRIVTHYEQMKQVAAGTYRYLLEGGRLDINETLEENGVDVLDWDEGLVKVEAVLEAIGGFSVG